MQTHLLTQTMLAVLDSKTKTKNTTGENSKLNINYRIHIRFYGAAQNIRYGIKHKQLPTIASPACMLNHFDLIIINAEKETL